MKTLSFSVAKLAIFGMLISATMAHAAVVIGFDNVGDFSANFRQTYNPAETTTVQSGGVVSATATGLNNGTVVSESFIYDTTPADATVKNTFSGATTISFDLRSTQISSFGIYIVNPSETAGVSGHRLALFNLNNSGTSDQLRIFSTSAINSAVVGTAAYNSGAIDVADFSTGFVTASLTYSESATSPGHAVMNFTVNGVGTGDFDLGAGTYLSSYEIGLRLYDGSTAAGSADIDNFTVVPEPSTVGLALLGLVSMGALHRHRRIARLR